MKSTGRHGLTLSVVIPSFNSAQWLPSTLSALEVALSGSEWEAEVIVVDDGSTDGTTPMLEALAGQLEFPLTVHRQENSGRFLARWQGLQLAKGRFLLLLDARVLLGADSLSYAQKALEADPSLVAWNAHTVTDPSAPLVGHFWAVPTFVFWGSYLGKPHPIFITPQNFDSVPKGTTCFLLEADRFRRACEASWPRGDAHFASDDTKLLRFIVDEAPVRLDPGFRALYRPRANFTSFISHARVRGTLFVDSYAGTGVIRNAVLIAFAVLPPVALIALVVLVIAGLWHCLFGLLFCGLVLAVVPAGIAAVRHCPGGAIASYLTLIIPFSAVFWAGLARGVVVHRGAFRRSSSRIEKAQP